MRQATLLFLKDDSRILLAMKKRGFGEGRWNGVGGKPHEGETIEQAAKRECEEEIGVIPTSMRQVAVLNFYFPKEKQRQGFNQQVIVFMCSKWLGEPAETEEMAPKWFGLEEIPYEAMWSDDKYWLPKVINGEYVTADFYFDDSDGLLKYSVNS